MAAAPALRHVRAGKGIVAEVAPDRLQGPNLRAKDFYVARRREDAQVQHPVLLSADQLFPVKKQDRNRPFVQEMKFGDVAPF